ncbi:MAG: response regulator [Lachnospiraceae bacterium]|nr:response regulator [Lachnospiraceae bacterium]
MYNIYFEVAAVGFLAILLLYLHVEYPKASESNILYRQWVAWILVSEILDIITGRMIDYGYLIPPVLNILVNTVYFYTTAGSFWGFARYLHSFVRSDKSRIYIGFNTAVVVLYICIMTLNVFTGWVFTFDGAGQYIHGPVYFLSYGIQIVVGTTSSVLLWTYRDSLEKRQKMAVWLFMILIVSGFLLQAVFFSKILLTSYMSSIAAMTLLFIIETPDYLRLTQTMEELEHQKNLADIANNAKSEFLARMSHEIRTPLNGILGMDEMIIRDARDDTIKKYAADIKGAGNTLLSLINDLLDMSKIESGNFELIPVDYDLSSVLNDVKNITEPRALKKGLGYELTVSPDIPSVFNGDEIRIRQIVLNIINNAIKYTNEGRVCIEITALPLGDPGERDLTVKVSDTGIGIRDEDKDKLFKSFQRLDEERNRTVEGTGLGLSITDRLVNMMGGHIEVESVYGKGSVFTVHIPQTVVNAAPLGEFSKAILMHTNENQAEKTTLYAPDARILIVDDNEMNLEVIEGLLRDTRIRLDLAASGKECIEMVSKKRYDCVLLDQMMPVMNGEETLKEMERADLLQGTPVIALTADAIVGAKDNYLSKGFSDYISKPVKLNALEGTLRRYIPQEKQLKDPVRSSTGNAVMHEGLPSLLLWGDDPQKLRAEKERLSGLYQCICVTGRDAMEKYLAKHEPDGIFHVL